MGFESFKKWHSQLVKSISAYSKELKKVENEFLPGKGLQNYLLIKNIS